MRALLTCVLLTFSLASFADTYEELYETAGWTEQRANFADALTAAQQRYKDTLPPAVFQALVTNSNRRFASHAIDQRAQRALREHGAETVSVVSLDYVFDRENPLFARLEAFLRQ